MQGTSHNIRRLPIYIDGFNAGQHLGLRIALETILAERANQEQTAERRGGTPRAYRHMFAAYVLLDVCRRWWPADSASDP